MKRVGKELSRLAKHKSVSFPGKAVKRRKVNKMGVSTEVVTYEVPDKSFSDKKDYRIFYLPNKLKVLLISDPSPIAESDSDASTINTSSLSEEEAYDGESTSSSDSDTFSGSSQYSSCSEGADGQEKMAAASLLVDVGSFSDPADINGLAHFLEHMIFMGSKKYPGENEYDKFIRKHGGSDNATTDCEDTIFYFDIPEKHLEGALDIFSRLFVEPLLEKDAITRERESVDSEFLTRSKDDMARLEQLISSQANTDHPCHLFAWGNLETLKHNISDQALHDRVAEFQKRHYSSHRMYLTLQARYPLDELERVARKYFSDIPCNDLPGTDFSCWKHTNVFQKQFFEKIYHVKPIAAMKCLHINWCFPSILNEFKCKPQILVEHLFDNEQKGSLCAYLRKNLWILHLSAEIDESDGFCNNSLYAIFSIQVNLTDKGYENISSVIEAIFSYIKLLHEKEDFRKIYEELQAIEDAKFKYSNEKDAVDNVEELVINLKYYPAKNVLNGSKLLFEYDKEQIQTFIDRLFNDPCNIMIWCNDETPRDQKEKWFGTEYRLEDMSEEWKSMRKNVEIFPEFDLDQTNNFITTDFTILHPTITPMECAQPPSLIRQDKLCELWFREDTRFGLPRAYINFGFSSALPLQSDKNAAMMRFYVLTLKYLLLEELTAASVAHLSFYIICGQRSVVIKVNGYNEKLHLIVDAMVRKMSNLEQLTEDLFQTLKTGELETYYNTLLKPKSLNGDVRVSILEKAFTPLYKKYNAVHTLTLEEIIQFSKDFLKTLKIQGLIQGNMTKEEALSITENVVSVLKSEPIDDLATIEKRAYQIPLGNNCVRVKGVNQKDMNSFVMVFYQTDAPATENACFVELLVNILEEPLFNQLRTIEQLGYDVNCDFRENCGFHAWTIGVNSQESQFSVEHVDERIEKFMEDFVGILREMSPEDYKNARESVIKTKLMPDVQLRDEVTRNWGEIVTEQYVFDRINKEVEILRNISQEQLIEFLQKYAFDEKFTRKLSIHVRGNKLANETDLEQEQLPHALHLVYDVPNVGDTRQKFIDDVDKFRESLLLHPAVNKTLH
ncbi:nardilysin [Phlebotomus argentipes]|uniref:nardilysin n=1 Tax=Phlebotomus argentipes TaxID=94469 RepID=UPI002892BEAE|nr:nardilysin [Phlebotomus argentipes]